jgi:dephospho-CoA kinase
MKKQKLNKKVLVGLTGGFGTGKSTVAGMFKESGARVIDADRLSRGFLKPGTGVYKKILRLFGKKIADRSGIVDRRKLGKIVFSDKKSLAALGRIMHPAIIREMKLEIKKAKENIVVMDAPLLFEAGLENSVDKVVVVKASRANQIKRARKKTGLSKAEIVARIKSQIPLKNKLRLADFVIDNNKTVRNTRKQVALIRRSWWRS